MSTNVYAVASFMIRFGTVRVLCPIDNTVVLLSYTALNLASFLIDALCSLLLVQKRELAVAIIQ